MTALVGIGLIGAYVTLPFWVPTGLLKGYLTRQMSEQMGVDVQIADVSLSWSEGVVLRQLRIASPSGFSYEHAVIVETIRADLSPVDFLLHKRIAWMEVDSPRVFVQVDSEGNTNLAPLRSLRFDADAQRISVRGAELALRLPHHDRMLQVRVSDAEYVAGRMQKLGRVTVSAVLDQQDRPAPVSLRVATGTDHDPAAADLLFNFANIDMEQLYLPKVFGLPLKRLAGLCRGSLNLRMNRRGEVDRFGCNLVIRDLDVLTAAGTQLPVIEEAGFRMTATYDPLTRHLDILSGSIRLPGVDLTGSGSLFTDVREGGWQAIRSLNLEGELRPSRLVALLTGQTQLSRQLEVTGPLGVKISVSCNEKNVAFFAEAQGISAAIRQGARVIKPSGRKLSMDLKANLDLRNWQLVVDSDATHLHLGGNTFSVGGSVSNMRRLIELLEQVPQELSCKLIRQIAGLLNCHGSWQIRELESLRGLPGPFTDLLETAELGGQIDGKWSIGELSETHVGLSALIPSEAQLTVGGMFVKNTLSPLRLELTGKLHKTNPAIEDLTVDLTSGEGRISVAAGTLHFTDNRPAKIPSMRGECTFSVHRIESILEQFPNFESHLNTRISGNLEGQCRLETTEDTITLDLEAALEEVSVECGRYFRKPSGGDGRLTAKFEIDSGAALGNRHRMQLNATLGEAELSVAGVFSEDLPPDGTARFTASAKIHDGRWLADSIPLLEERLGDVSIKGPIECDVTGSWDGRKLTGQFNCNADGLAFAWGGQNPRVKDSGVPLRLSLDAIVETTEELQKKVEVRSREVLFGETHLRFAGWGVLETESGDAVSNLARPCNVKRFEGDFKASVKVDDNLLKLVPELTDPVRRGGLSGMLTVRGRIRGDAKDSVGLIHVDAADFSVAHAGPFVKPKGTPTEIELELTAPTDLTRLRVNHARVQMGDVTLLGDADVHLEQGGGGWSKRLGRTDAHISLWTGDTERLWNLVPRLKPYQLRGEAFLECQLAYEPGNAVRIPSMSLKTKGLTGNYREKDILLRGEVGFHDLELRPGELPLVGRFITEGLELRAGENHCWVIADLADLPAAATGTFHFLGTSLDDKDLREWIWPTDASAPTSRPQTSPSPGSQALIRLTDQETESLRTEAERIIDSLKLYLASAKIDGRGSVDRLTSYDPSVERTYEVQGLEVAVSVNDGHVTLGYAGSLNGGTIRNTYEVRLSDTESTVAYETSMRDVIATESIQPQLGKYFPGNTFSGLFNRVEKSSVPLRDLVGNSLDHRYQLFPVGTAKTISTDGVVEGRAAPRFVTHIFPGLNLTKYRYNKMTSFATFRPDGIAENDMVFSGKTYDIYIEGTTDTENIGRYQMGLILLGRPQSAEWNHLYRQGRIPILKIKGRIEGGKIHDEVVSYPWPNETLGVIFVKNNIFYRAWLARKGE